MNPSRRWLGLVLLSVACGSKFEATSGSDTAGSGSGEPSDTAGGGSMNGGALGSAGKGSGSGAGASAAGGSDGGSVGTGAAGSGASSGSMHGSAGSGTGGHVAVGGASGSTGVSGSVGSSGSAGNPNAGAGNAGGGANAGAGNAGGSAGADCASLQSTYLADLEKARVCNPSAVKPECSNDSTLPGSCQCPVLVASGTAATAKAKVDLKAFSDAGCKVAACGIACIQYQAAVCATASGSSSTVCSGAAATP